MARSVSVFGFTRRWLFSLYVLWTSYMAISNNWHLFQEFWAVSVTMAFGSFIAGATPQGEGHGSLSRFYQGPSISL